MNEINSLNPPKAEFLTSKTNIKSHQPQKAEAKHQIDLSDLNNYKRDLVKLPPKEDKDKSPAQNPLDRFTVPSTIRNFSHALSYFMDRTLFHTLKSLTVTDGYWAQTPIKAETACPWKIHIYADTEEDWKKLVSTVGEYLNTQKVDWKTLSAKNPVAELNSDKQQKGKAFTIYAPNTEQFKQLASDIDYIIRHNKLEKENTKIQGDRQLGSTGRIFYRYDRKTAEIKDKIFHTDNEEEMNEFQSLYDSNRSDDNYLPSGMTTAEDPFFDFNPQQ